MLSRVGRRLASLGNSPPWGITGSASAMASPVAVPRLPFGSVTRVDDSTDCWLVRLARKQRIHVEKQNVGTDMADLVDAIATRHPVRRRFRENDFRYPQGVVGQVFHRDSQPGMVLDQ